MKYTLTQQIQLNHASVRKYLKKPLDPGQLEKLIKCGQSASSSNFIQAYSIIRVRDRGVRAAIASAAGGQEWVESAPEFLVFCADLQKVNVVCRYAGKGELEGYSEHALAAIIDVTILAQNVMLAAESDGLGGVFIGGIRNEPDILAKELSLPELVVPVFGMCLGWPDHKTETKPRMPIDYVLCNDTYSEIDEDSVKKYDSEVAKYYLSRGGDQKHVNWSDQVANAIQGRKRPHILSFLNDQKFFIR